MRYIDPPDGFSGDEADDNDEIGQLERRPLAEDALEEVDRLLKPHGLEVVLYEYYEDDWGFFRVEKRIEGDSEK